MYSIRCYYSLALYWLLYGIQPGWDMAVSRKWKRLPFLQYNYTLNSCIVICGEIWFWLIFIITNLFIITNVFICTNFTLPLLFIYGGNYRTVLISITLSYYINIFHYIFCLSVTSKGITETDIVIFYNITERGIRYAMHSKLDLSIVLFHDSFS